MNLVLRQQYPWEMNLPSAVENSSAGAGVGCPRAGQAGARGAHGQLEELILLFQGKRSNLDTGSTQKRDKTLPDPGHGNSVAGN